MRQRHGRHSPSKGSSVESGNKKGDFNKQRKGIIMKKNRMFIVSLATILLLCFAVSGWTAAPAKPKGYPERPIEVVVQYGAGGGSDIFVRSLMNAARKDIGGGGN